MEDKEVDLAALSADLAAEYSREKEEEKRIEHPHNKGC